MHSGADSFVAILVFAAISVYTLMITTKLTKLTVLEPVVYQPFFVQKYVVFGDASIAKQARYQQF